MDEKEPPSIKCVVVGDGSVGKTCLLIRYAKDEYPTSYIPTVFDNYSVSIPISNELYKFHLFDTAGQEDFEQLRRLAFTNTDVFLVCFAVDRWASFINVREVWIPELQKYCPGVPYLIVGTRIDLRNDQATLENLSREGKTPISKAQGEKLAKELSAVKYVECSSLTKENINDVFQEAIVVALTDSAAAPPSPKSKVIENTSHFNNLYNNNNKTTTSNTNNNDPSKTGDGACCCSCSNCCAESCTIL